MKKLIIITYCILLCICAQNTYAQGKHALLIGLSEYGKDTGWNDIHGTNDIDLIKTVLKDYDIHELRNSDATYDNIIKAFTSLSQRCKKGDIVYLHFSGHGQPIEDLDNDEDDGWDESFIPYDAHKEYKEGVYDGSKHLTDDYLNSFYSKIQQILGSTGLLIVAMDACHSGDSVRDAFDIDDYFERGSADGFCHTKDNIYRPLATSKNINFITRSENEANLISIEACLPYQSNYEIKIEDSYYGPLSYSICKLLETTSFSDDSQWILRLQEIMKESIPKWSRQTMMIESTVKFKSPKQKNN